MLDKNKFYPIAIDSYQCLNMKNLPVNLRKKGYQIMGKMTGEYRKVSPGEWFLSGSIPECHYNANDELSMKYHIIVPVLVKKIVSYELVKELI